MEFNLFIIPMTLIIVELAKGLEINKKYLPIVSVALGAILGACSEFTIMLTYLPTSLKESYTARLLRAFTMSLLSR